MEMKEIGTIYSTTDYGIFKRLDGNREVTYERRKKLEESIKTHGYLLNPIKVNENMQIIEGQGRFFALKSLGLPIQYYVSPGSGIDDCIVMNAYNTNWATINYLKSNTELGDEECAKFIDLMNRYNLPVSVAAIAFLGKGKNIGKMLKNGTFHLNNEENLEEIQHVCSIKIVELI